jgi:hypothetical protein
MSNDYPSERIVVRLPSLCLQQPAEQEMNLDDGQMAGDESPAGINGRASLTSNNARITFSI